MLVRHRDLCTTASKDLRANKKQNRRQKQSTNPSQNTSNLLRSSDKPTRTSNVPTCKLKQSRHQQRKRAKILIWFERNLFAMKCVPWGQARETCGSLKDCSVCWSHCSIFPRSAGKSFPLEHLSAKTHWSASEPWQLKKDTNCFVHYESQQTHLAKSTQSQVSIIEKHCQKFWSRLPQTTWHKRNIRKWFVWPLVPILVILCGTAQNTPPPTHTQQKAHSKIALIRATKVRDTDRSRCESVCVSPATINLASKAQSWIRFCVRHPENGSKPKLWRLEVDLSVSSDLKDQRNLPNSVCFPHNYVFISSLNDTSI